MSIGKRAQMEILGLAIVVVLVILGMLFVIKFMSLQEPGNLRQPVVQSQTAASYITAYLKTNVPDCRGLTVTDLLQDCAVGGGITCEDGSDSCRKAEEVAEEVFSRTFEVWRQPYYFVAFMDEGSPLVELGEQCPGERRTRQFPLPTGVDTMFVRLDLCG